MNDCNLGKSINSTLGLGVGSAGTGGGGGVKTLGEAGKIGELSSHHCSSHSGGLTGILPLTRVLQ